MPQKDFIKAGFTVVDANNEENKLLSFLKENCPNVIRDNEINIEELKAVLDLPIDEKVNGYGLNFVGRNFARAKYSKKTEKELHLNTSLSKDIDKTENLVLKGDNLDSLKILKNHYTGKIKCIYIDPPYNTTSDEFVYPDKFDKEEAEVLGLANLSESDFDRMDFSFKTKKSHNGWLAFMYPRLLLARDLLSKDGVIFISIDDNEQANLKLLCDDVFGEENFLAQIIHKNNSNKNQSKLISVSTEYMFGYSKHKEGLKEIIWRVKKKGAEDVSKKFIELQKLGLSLDEINKEIKEMYKRPKYSHLSRWNKVDENGVFKDADLSRENGPKNYTIINPNNGKECVIPNRGWGKSLDELKRLQEQNLIWYGDENTPPGMKDYIEHDDVSVPDNFWFFDNSVDTKWVKDTFSALVFENPKPLEMIKQLIQIVAENSEFILDFFAGSGTTGHAVMQLNAEDGGNRKFILCQIDEPIDKKKPAYKFCVENNLPPVISSITIERLKRAGEKIDSEINVDNEKAGMFKEHKKQIPDIGYKVFDSVDSPKLEVDDSGQISINLNDNDTLSRIYNMIFTIGLDEPSQVPEEVVEDCIYKIGDHFYITNSEKVSKEDFANAIKNGKVFIDGWTASLNGTLQNYKEDVKIVF
ncbi:MAG: site-specific DNA-methyltransferase [Bacteroidales bacterium]|nr:site-specific DNA-methyltransferase [Bacteroidales bacterium]